jgi:CheY-like chemotaxis protein
LDDDILNDFKTVQNSLISGEDEAGSITATILILDDDEDNRTLFKDALDVSDETYNFIEADTTDEALEALTSQDASLILMNLDGNIGDAGSFLEQVASNPDFPAIPIVVNSTENDEIEDAIRAGATDYFSRPLDVMDVEYQVPRKISNLIKLQKAEHLLADGAGSEASADSDDLDDLGLDDDMDEFDDLMLDDGDEDDGMDDLDDLLSGTDEDDGLLPEDLIAGVSTGGGGAATATRRKGKKRLIPITDQRRMIRERERKSYASKDRSSKLPLVLGMALLVIVSAGLSAVAVNYVMNQKQQEVATVTPAAPPKPAPVLQQPKMAQKDFEMAKQRTERPNTFQRQADEAKIRIRQTVQELESTGGAWWSPWRIMRNTGASLDRLVNRRQVSDIRDAFGVDRAAVNAGLQNRSTLDYLASVGFDMRGKSAEELNARETFELLSARQIKDTNQIVDILSSLQDKLAKDRTRQARRRARQKKTSETAALDRKPDVALPWVNRTVGLDTRNPVRETDEISQGSSMRQSTEHRDFWRTT